jgi:hypothetical protein
MREGPIQRVDATEDRLGTARSPDGKASVTKMRWRGKSERDRDAAESAERYEEGSSNFQNTTLWSSGP